MCYFSPRRSRARKVMHRLAKLGFYAVVHVLHVAQDKEELTEYFTELAQDPRASTSVPTAGQTRRTYWPYRCITPAAPAFTVALTSGRHARAPITASTGRRSSVENPPRGRRQRGISEFGEVRDAPLGSDAPGQPRRRSSRT